MIVKHMKQFKLVALGFIFLSLVSCSPNPKQVSYGKFFTMRELYSKKIIDKNDIVTMSYYNSDGNDIYYEYPFEGKFDFSPYKIKERNPDDLTEEIKTKIINDHYYDVYLPIAIKDIEQHDIDSVKILKFCGVFNGYYAVKIHDTLGRAQESGIEEVCGILFENSVRDVKVVLWKEN